MINYANIPDHEHTASVYTHCLDCHTFGIDLPTDFISASKCGNCTSMRTVKYYPSCCIMADREQAQIKTKSLQEQISAIRMVIKIISKTDFKGTNSEFNALRILLTQIIAEVSK